WRSQGTEFTKVESSTGLADIRVGAIHRAHDGRLWFGADSIAKAFDGSSSINLTLPARIFSIQSLANGDMCFGTIRGAYQWNGKLGDKFTQTNGVPGDVCAIAVGGDGRVWFGTSRGLFRGEAGHGAPVRTQEPGLRR